MAYNKLRTFGDFRGFVIELSVEVWIDHIQSNHPEVRIESIDATLAAPDEVWVSQSRDDVELYYLRKEPSEKLRYWMVSVKKTAEGRFVSSAMTKSTIVGSQRVFKKG